MFSKNSVVLAFVGSATAITREPLLTWKSTSDKVIDKTKNYYVPNFGDDREMALTKKHLDWAEKKLGRKWNVKPEDLKKKKKEDYTVPNFGVDHDIRQT